MSLLTNWIADISQQMNVSAELIPYVNFIILLAVTGLGIVISVFLTRLILRNTIGRILHKTKNRWDDLIAKNNFFNALSLLTAVFILKITIPDIFKDMPDFMFFMNKAADIFFLIVIYRIINALLKNTEHILEATKTFEDKPLTSYFQLIKIIIIIAMIIFGLSILIGKSPLYFLTAFGAMSAIVLLIFKDTILGIVASVQISANDMIREGDWVSMPEFNADGDVLSINLNTVKIENWDKTVSTVPTYYFITQSFRNWRAMQESGGRRIMRTLLIDINSIQFVDDEMKEAFKKIDLIQDYIKKGEQEFEFYNKAKQGNSETLVNGQRMTNIGVFREYITRYLNQHSGLHNPKDKPAMYQLVRQMEPNEKGVPLQIWCYTKSVSWYDYEKVQSDIFDHLFAATSFFGLQIFQNPSGKDFRGFLDE